MFRKISLSAERFAFGFLLFAFAQSGLAFTKNGTIFITDGSQNDVAAAVASATNGCTVNIPSGSFIWGTNGSSINITANIVLQGAGTNSTMIYLAENGPTYGAGVISISAAALVCNFSIVGTNSGASAFSAGGPNGWTIANINAYDIGGSSATGYFCYVGNCYGLIDNCSITGDNGSVELIFGRGPTNSWQTPDSMGTTNAVYIENCTFGNQGYVCDANANERFVVRFCTINSQAKVDGHGKASNTPPRGVRQMEVYNNFWTQTSGYFPGIEIRGGTGVIFNNTNSIANLGNNGNEWLELAEYGCEDQWPNFTNTYQTPVNYPVDDQIGVGEDPKVAASDPVYVWCNGGVGNENPWVVGVEAVAAGAIALYTNQVQNPNATFTMTNIIFQDRDFYSDDYITSFNGSSGIGVGTYSQMQAITPTKTGVGFWATDQGHWNTTTTNTSGQLYVWNGSTWVLKYVPYRYPYPLTLPPNPPSGLRVNN